MRYTLSIMKKFIVVSALVLLPAFAGAAGFAKDSLFLSKSPVTEGDSVRIYAVLSNSAAAAFTGSVVVTDGDTKVGSAPVSIAVGGTQTVSVSWKPLAGSHTVTAELVAKDGTAVEQESATFTVAEKPKPIVPPPASTSSQPAAAVESSQQIQQQITNISPQVGQASQPVFGFFDGLRSGAADVLDGQIATTKQKLTTTKPSGIVAGSSATESPTITNPWGTAWYVLWTLYLYALTLLRWLVGNAGVFYPVLAIAFFYFLWRTYKRFRRPAWQR